MEVQLKDIGRYIDHLTATNAFSVTLHGDFVAVPELIRYNFHLNPYCRFVKTVTENWETCVKKQCQVFEKCNEGEFFGVCHAGVGEYVYPITVNGCTVGFISVGGYKGTNEEEVQKKAAHFAFKNGIDGKKVAALRDEFLLSAVPSKKDIDTVIHPLLCMLEAYLQKKQTLTDKAGDNTLYTRLLQYVTEHHNTRLTMEELSRKMHCSVSTLSHLFKKESGMSLSDYVKKLRLEEAKWLLRQSEDTIMEISDCLGFCNPAYFSAVFKETYGVSPKTYRKMSPKG